MRSGRLRIEPLLVCSGLRPKDQDADLVDPEDASLESSTCFDRPSSRLNGKQQPSNSNEENDVEEGAKPFGILESQR